MVLLKVSFITLAIFSTFLAQVTSQDVENYTCMESIAKFEGDAKRMLEIIQFTPSKFEQYALSYTESTTSNMQRASKACCDDFHHTLPVNYSSLETLVKDVEQKLVAEVAKLQPNMSPTKYARLVPNFPIYKTRADFLLSCMRPKTRGT